MFIPRYSWAQAARGAGPGADPDWLFEIVNGIGAHDRATTGLESSPVVEALAGLRATEARYFKNKYDHDFTVEPASKAKKAVEWVYRILKEERRGPTLEATAFQVENIRMAYVFYESGLSSNVMYTVDDPKKRFLGAAMQSASFTDFSWTVWR